MNVMKDKNVIIEIRTGAGGNEANSFASDLYRAYYKYAELKNWEVDILEIHETKKGFNKIVFGIQGKDVFNRMKFESGVHRVQRIPASEANGRLHTSTISVAVLPEAKEIDIIIDPNDLKIDTFNAGGNGGQSVQKNATAVRFTHKPTKTVVVCQDERSLEKNKQRAMSVLRSRLFQKAQEEQATEINKNRYLQIGSADRAEKIRTYNYPNDRITDHRNNSKFSNIKKIMAGDMDKMIDGLLEWERE